MILETTRLILRPWEESDAEALYKFASDPRVGPAAGLAVHTSVENNREIIHKFFSDPEIYAVVLKEVGHPVGGIRFTFNNTVNNDVPPKEAEIGYWIGVPYWGQGLIPEAVREMLRHGFEDLHLEEIWCWSNDENKKSQRVQEKCGFKFHHTLKNIPNPLDGTLRTVHSTRITREQWLAGK